MKNSIKSVFLYLAMALSMCWSLSAMAAEKAPLATHVPLESMTRTEYENYRSQLNQQVNGENANTPAAEKPSGQSEEEDPEAKKKEEEQSGSSGYGKGYRARMERNARTGRTGGYRGGSMSRGGGGRNR